MGASLAGEPGDAVAGTGCAGVRRQAGSYGGCGLQCPWAPALLANQATRWLAPATPVFAGKAGSYAVCDLQCP
ncbi:hypothetical protein [Pseudomonas muyukensis]|uniref:Uncharacterized protein n=1 Tax=Pseudomonas muyukensis TaxID=2842357 RepID=A0ABX8MFB6_9PSED|nr:hypothetical protein [Pseudomonas muyukensis]QXH37758.1 hypothetical protein KSS95_14315 [Pseudomonas muyukensis]